MTRTLLKNNTGFTLVETMVAISILSLAITAPMVIAQKGIGSAIYSRDQITASYLAQEAVEYVRNVRDSNRISHASWLSGLASCTGGQVCTIDAHYTNPAATGAITVCPAGVCPLLSINTSATTNKGLYGYDADTTQWRPTIFKRSVSINTTGDASGKEALVSVTVTWTTNLFAPVKTFTIREYIFNF